MSLNHLEVYELIDINKDDLLNTKFKFVGVKHTGTGIGGKQKICILNNQRFRILSVHDIDKYEKCSYLNYPHHFFKVIVIPVTLSVRAVSYQ